MGLFGLGGANSKSSHLPACYTSSTVPGRQIEKNLGLVQYTQKGIAGDAPEEIQSVFLALLREAQAAGGNAVVNVRLQSGSYEQQGSKWQVTYLVAFGDAVLLG